MPSNYQPGIPTGRVNLDVDYQNLQDNFQQLDTTFGQNHTKVSDTSSQNGYHTNIQFIPQSPTPPPVAGFGQLFTETINDGYSSDEALFYLSGGGNNTLLTRNFLPLMGPNGYTFAPGQLVIQWGIVDNGGNSFVDGQFGTVTFATANKDFQNACFGVLPTPMNTGIASVPTEAGIIIIDKSLITTTSFRWNFVGGSRYRSFFWVALGY